jgi:hypothetical protein
VATIADGLIKEIARKTNTISIIHDQPFKDTDVRSSGRRIMGQSK